MKELCHSAFISYVDKYVPDLPKNLSYERFAEIIQLRFAELLSPGDSTIILSDEDAKLKMHLNVIINASKTLQSTASHITYYDQIRDILMPYLDTLKWPSIDLTDQTIFTNLTRKYKDSFMRDLRELNCLAPNIITRVSEYIPQIVHFVKRLVDKGFSSKFPEGSVYFDISALEKANHPYARLEPWNRSNKVLQADGEGALSNKVTEKRSDADFALWKASKPGEPSWPSPWGDGRPGWHIECSAMTSDVFGKVIDIHSGGIDLAFPHHDNELAQSEAYWHDAADELENCHHQWVNYFLQMGHLSIQGLKMSKSLKNFITVKEALSKGEWTARGLRIIFLLTGWKESMEITASLIKSGQAWEYKINNFFSKG